MRLYCQFHKELEHFRGSEIERVLYAFQEILLLAERAIPDGPGVPEGRICLRYVADVSHADTYRTRVDRAVNERISRGGGL
jgi:hypothetical protein